MIASSNAVNLTDGLDGLAIGLVFLVAIAFAILAYITGRADYAQYLQIPYVAGSGELAVLSLALIGASIGFLWFNACPAEMFMGDTGSLCLGGIIGVFALLIRKEGLLVILCGVFLVETLSVMLQVSYNKYHLRRYGVGKRLFRMTPLHHHFAASERGITWEYVIHQKPIHEAKVVTRFFLIAIFLAVITFVTLKIR